MSPELSSPLFEEPEGTIGAAVEKPLFADIVFDRPLDHAYSYAVPPELAARIAVGKRVEAPFGRGDSGTIGYCVRVSDEVPTRAVKNLKSVLDEESLLTDALLRLTRWMADYYLCGWGQVLQAVLPAGVRDQAGTRESIFVEAIVEAELPKDLRELTKKQAEVLDKLRREGCPLEQRQLAKLAQCTTGVIAALLDKGYVRRFVNRVERLDISAEDPPHTHVPITLNDDQLQVFAPIETAALGGGFKAFLLRGVTGSGKTEIYLRAIEEVIQQGKEAIVLVPEISLTPQTIERFRGRCGEVAVLHSHLTDSERGAHWRRVAAGKVNVIVGARSAIFAPARRLGLIVIDEEHENTFKQESTPRYHARDVAVMRAKLENIPIVMGTATPSLESWHNAHKGNYTLLSLPNRVLERPMPLVRLIDLRHEPKTGGIFHAISPTLQKGMEKALGSGGQVMLLLNRRGFSTHVHCTNCGHVATCERCDLAMTYHRGRNSLLCHYCAFETQPYQKCPMCSQPTVRYQGLGTEKLQAELLEKFPGKVTERMDSDTMQKPGSHRKTLDAFREGAVQILLGTQMIAKGLDFPNVTLVGVINADVGLHQPDFRAGERTFQLLAQVAGRTGRGARGGQVLIQTYTPEHPCIALATKHDFLKFAEMELAQRKEHQYPPYQRLARLIIRGLNEKAVQEFADQLAELFQEATRSPERNPPHAVGVRILGPAEAPVYRLNNYFRFHFQVQSASPGLLHQVLRDVVTKAKSTKG
ncbi:MAG: primosomal protein N', partial [Planctomycetes bacterium]|nr:primosomal protein N' [Planctomycetota bacterium]